MELNEGIFIRVLGFRWVYIIDFVFFLFGFVFVGVLVSYSYFFSFVVDYSFNEIWDFFGIILVIIMGYVRVIVGLGEFL